MAEGSLFLVRAVSSSFRFWAFKKKRTSRERDILVWRNLFETLKIIIRILEFVVVDISN